MNRPDYRKIEEHLLHMAASLLDLAETCPLPDAVTLRITPEQAADNLILRCCLQVAADALGRHAERAHKLHEQVA